MPPLSANAWLRYDVIQRLIPDGVHDVLEIGCGLGGVGARLARRFRYVGLEPDASSFEIARGRLASEGSGVVLRDDGSRLLKDERFDLVCAFEVLEHVDDDRAALLKWRRWLRDGGWLLLSTPAHSNRFGAADVMAGHYRRYDPSTMVDLLRGLGFADVNVQLYGMPLGYALEAGRNLIGRVRARQNDIADRTAASGRLLQPSHQISGLLTRGLTAPFRRVQRFFPGSGPGLVVRARWPSPT
jgi:SAM-dependent methyltransferase